MIALRPQPVGIYPPPAANLLLPAVADDGAGGALRRVLHGGLDREGLPDAWQFFAAAVQGDVSEALRLVGNSDSDLAVYNRFVLQPDAASYPSARRRLARESGSEHTDNDGGNPVHPAADIRTGQSARCGQLVALLDVAAYAAGIVDTVASDFSLDGELLAWALANAAACELEQDDVAAAASTIRQAMAAADGASPILAAILTAQHTDLMAATPGFAPALAINAYQQAIRSASDCELPLLLAELHTKLGMAFQNAANGQRGALLQAVNAYQTALQHGITKAEFPEMFAELQNNLGLAYLSMPAMEASNQLRTGIAVQSFRQALAVYTIESHPDRWASVSMNLANALVYAPSSHPEDNLIQAVETYEQVLQVRSRAKDPVAYALVLLNQANALAHLGMFKPALEKLAEAYKLFHWYEEIEQANAARELVEQINERMGKQGATRLENSHETTESFRLRSNL